MQVRAETQRLLETTRAKLARLPEHGRAVRIAAGLGLFLPAFAVLVTREREAVERHLMLVPPTSG